MQIYLSPVKNLFFEGNPHFYVDLYPQCLALGFQLIFVNLNLVEKAIVEFEMFPQFRHPNQICVNPKLYQLQASRSWEVFSFKWKVLYYREFTWKWQTEKTKKFITNRQFLSMDKPLGEFILGKE